MKAMRADVLNVRGGDAVYVEDEVPAQSCEGHTINLLERLRLTMTKVEGLWAFEHG